jgi:hypothetical protein
MLFFILPSASWLDAWLIAALLVIVLVLALGAIAVMWQQSRARATRRWLAALDAYAQRQIEQERRRTALHRMQGLFEFLGIPRDTADHRMLRRLAI